MLQFRAELVQPLLGECTGPPSTARTVRAIISRDMFTSIKRILYPLFS